MRAHAPATAPSTPDDSPAPPRRARGRAFEDHTNGARVEAPLRPREAAPVEAPASPWNREEAEHLSLMHRRLTELPESIGRLTRLKVLHLDGNKLTTLPLAFGRLAGLETLQLSGNPLVDLPERAIAGLTSLRTLDVSRTPLRRLPVRLTRLPLETLRLEAMTSLDWEDALAKVARLSNLSSLMMSDNALGRVPDRVCAMRSLRRLYLNDSQIVELPDALGRLDRLELLSVGGNRIRALPDALVALPSLKQLHLRGNPCYRREQTRLKTLRPDLLVF